MSSNRNLNLEFLVTSVYNIYVFAQQFNAITKDVISDDGKRSI